MGAFGLGGFGKISTGMPLALRGGLGLESFAPIFVIKLGDGVMKGGRKCVLLLVETFVRVGPFLRAAFQL